MVSIFFLGRKRRPYPISDQHAPRGVSWRSRRFLLRRSGESREPSPACSATFFRHCRHGKEKNVSCFFQGEGLRGKVTTKSPKEGGKYIEEKNGLDSPTIDKRKTSSTKARSCARQWKTSQERLSRRGKKFQKGKSSAGATIGMKRRGILSLQLAGGGS